MPQKENGGIDLGDEDELASQRSSRGGGSSKSSPYRIIYLRTTPEVCAERVQKRSRSSETTIGIDYLRQIHHKYEDWIGSIEAGAHAHPSIVSVVDANRSIEAVVRDVELLL